MSCKTSDNVCQDLQARRYCFHQQCHNVFYVTLSDNIQYQSQFVDTENITRRDQRKNVQITNKNK